MTQTISSFIAVSCFSLPTFFNIRQYVSLYKSFITVPTRYENMSIRVSEYMRV